MRDEVKTYEYCFMSPKILSQVLSQTNTVSSANCEIGKEMSQLTFANFPHLLFFCPNVVIPSVVIRNKDGVKRSPCRRPFDVIKSEVGLPVNRYREWNQCHHHTLSSTSSKCHWNPYAIAYNPENPIKLSYTHWNLFLALSIYP